MSGKNDKYNERLKVDTSLEDLLNLALGKEVPYDYFSRDKSGQIVLTKDSPRFPPGNHFIYPGVFLNAQSVEIQMTEITDDIVCYAVSSDARGEYSEILRGNAIVEVGKLGICFKIEGKASGKISDSSKCELRFKFNT